MAHNLYHALHVGAVNPNSHLHVVKPHIEAITKAFDSASVKRAIRSGGLSQTQQKAVVKKILALDPKAAESHLTKKTIKEVVQHFGEQKQESKKKMILQRRVRENAMAEQDMAHGATSIAQVVHPEIYATTSQTNRAPGSALGSQMKVAGSAGQLASRSSIKPGTLSTPPRSSPPPMPLKPLSLPPTLFKPPGR